VDVLSPVEYVTALPSCEALGASEDGEDELRTLLGSTMALRWTLSLTTYDCTLQITNISKVVFSVTVFTVLPGNIFQQWMSLYSRTHVLADWRPSQTNFLIF
jgi:hypothetical protein